jgi:putative transposase
MKRSRHTEEQSIHILQEAQAGAAVAPLCRRHGIGESTFYKWKQQFGGLKVDEARRLRRLEEENCKLKKLVADQALDAMVLKELLAKKS